jgi:DNA gyrase/topoisomerase IV subunit A
MRAIPSITDGLKAAGRRVLWTARDGKKYKSATLAGATMPIHPHASPDGAINTLAAPYGNNIPLLHGDGAFGTLLNPTAYGATRYTSVKVSAFAKEVLFADIDLVPLQDNYDGTLEEPVHFLPLVPLALLNPSEGIAVGFATNILPRSLEDIVNDQIKHIQGKRFKEKAPVFYPTDSEASKLADNKWEFYGEAEEINSTTLKITRLPYGANHEKYVEHLMKLQEAGTIVDFEDNSKNIYNIVIKFKRGALAEQGDKIDKLLKLISTSTENMNLLDFDGERVVAADYEMVIRDFTDWRLAWYKKRYQRLAKLLNIDIERYLDILLSIKKNIGGMVSKIQSRTEMKEVLKEMGIIHVDYIADLSVYRFTANEKTKTEKRLKDAYDLLAKYEELLTNPNERSKVYISELREVLKHKQKGNYE